MEMEIDGKVLRLETGEVGRLAAGAVICRMGNSVVYSTACGDLWEDKEETVEDFVPLRCFHTLSLSSLSSSSAPIQQKKVLTPPRFRSVHYQERSSAAGKTPGNMLIYRNTLKTLGLKAVDERRPLHFEPVEHE